jgi:hypothetical protein
MKFARRRELSESGAGASFGNPRGCQHAMTSGLPATQDASLAAATTSTTCRLYDQVDCFRAADDLVHVNLHHDLADINFLRSVQTFGVDKHT